MSDNINKYVRKKGVILGVGIVDVDYKTQTFSGKGEDRRLTWICPFYEKWKQMIRRCYSEKEKSKNNGYIGVTCDPSWLKLSVFKAWMETQQYLHSDGTMLELDKDILFEGNKVYSPETCVFIHHKVNSFIFKEDFYTQTAPLGVTYNSKLDKYQAQCTDPFRKRARHLCYSHSPDHLHLVYLNTKHKYACELADSEYVTDERVRTCLKNRYINR